MLLYSKRASPRVQRKTEHLSRWLQEQVDRGGIKVYLDDSFEIYELVKSVQGGITDCLRFMDEHYTKRISSLGTE